MTVTNSYKEKRLNHFDFAVVSVVRNLFRNQLLPVATSTWNFKGKGLNFSFLHMKRS